MNKKIFQNIELFDSDIYVGDYTEYAKTHTKYKDIGVKFSSKPLTDLNSLHIVNRNGIKVAAVNFQDNQHLLEVDGNLIKQCEGLCFAMQSRKHGWVLLIELKYCSEKNISLNIKNAIFQLENTLRHLREGINFIEAKDKVYWVVSLPDHSELEPFTSFILTQNELINLEENLNIVAFIARNKVEILTDSNLQIN